ncbi:MAG TPA: polymer-forming cytoskeletal protein [Myxococcota bacterium]|nr:polymer-forming cytoskeletal protein [Myxococcota bacterium]HRY92915.1 polymer-forming cytoskeletal protein [Myxococcota bacterium]HSA19866.1 polymer-forming cytoskeletal protein [Myxococcota bacterium]
MALWKRDTKTPPPARPAAPLAAPLTLPRGEELAPQPKKEKKVSLKTDEITTVLGKGSEFEGKLHFEGTLRIEGVFHGEIKSDSVLVVGEGAKVNAEVEIGTVIINGQVTGNIKAKQGVEIRAPGRMMGNIETPSLIIEKGVAFDGQCKMDTGVKAAPASFVKPEPAKVEKK